MKPVFSKLLKGYPSANHPCDGPWANQCAIRMSIALNTEGTIPIGKDTYSEPKCAHGHARGAESLANFLFKKMGRPTRFTDGAEAKKAIAGMQGIIFFKDCFIRAGEKVAVGDHIDLWLLDKTMTYSDPTNLSKQVWFWTLT